MEENGKEGMTRRTFLKSTGALAATSLTAGSLLGFAGAAHGTDDTSSRKGRIMQKRALGKTGEKLSIIGFGGIVVCGTEQTEANAIVREAVERGINYFDVAPSYCGGEAEARLGPALKEFRKDVFLACKTTERGKDGAQAELEQSLKRLQTDYFDVYQLHGVSNMEDVEKAMGPGGAIETFVAAKKKGLVRFLGFSAHSADAAIALMDQFDFDTILFPFNWVCYLNADFGPQVIAKAEEKGVGRLAIKAMARTVKRKDKKNEYPKCWYEPVTDPEETNLAVRFTLSLPITAAVPPGDVRLFRRAMDIASEFTPLTDEEREVLKRRAEGLQPIFKLS